MQMQNISIKCIKCKILSSFFSLKRKHLYVVYKKKEDLFFLLLQYFLSKATTIAISQATNKLHNGSKTFVFVFEAVDCFSMFLVLFLQFIWGPALLLLYHAHCCRHYEVHCWITFDLAANSDSFWRGSLSRTSYLYTKQ